MELPDLKSSLNSLVRRISAGRGGNESGTPVGVEIGPGEIKVAVLDEAAGRPRVIRLLRRVTPDTLVSRDTIQDTEAMAAELRQALSEAGVGGGSPVTLVVTGSDVFVKRIQLPRAAADVARKSVYGRVPGFNAEQHQADVHVLDPEGASGEMDALVVGVKKDAVRDRQRVAADAGVRTHAIDADFAALFNLYFATDPTALRSAKPTALVHVGASSTTVVLVEKGVPVAARSAASGFEDLLRDLARNEAMRGREPRLVAWESDLPMVFPTEYQRWLKKLSADVARAIRAAGGESWSGRIFLSGDGGAVPGVADAIREAAGDAPIRLFNPLSKLTCNDPVIQDGNNAALGFALALGLALRQTS